MKRDLLRKVNSRGFKKGIWTKAGKCMGNYNMIEPGDRIAVGISGGKDSITLLNLLIRAKCISGVDFEIFPIHIKYKEEKNEDLNELKEYIKDLGYELFVKDTRIEEIVFEEKEEKNPCSLCSRLKRGVIYNIMQEKNYNKLALGHHLDDLIETFLMNFFYQGNMNKMHPKYKSDKYGFEIIRPLSYVEERDIIKYAKKLDFPLVESSCRYDAEKNSKRLKMKKLIKKFHLENKHIRQVVKSSLGI